ncbi:MAG TPA: sigma-70 family RNA polymerase sigma factor [bacterium]|nr:sigma-70 family RNA polymerase sigma factor [bacterium]
MADLAEKEVIAGALSRSPEAWQRLLSLYGRKVYSIALRFMANEKDAEDVTQEVWLLISQKLAEFRGEAKLGTWIYRIATNKCLEKLRSSAKKKTESIEALLPQFQEDGHYVKEFEDWSERPAVKTESSLLKQELEKIIRALPEEYRQVLVLRDVEGLTGEETADMLQINEATMKTRLHRGRMAMREKLEKKYGAKPWFSFLRMIVF